MNQHKLLVQKILEKPKQYPWPIQGFGLLRLYLSDEVRLHVWDRTYQVPGVSVVHTHPWNLHSEIIAGSLINTLYTPKPGGNYLKIQIKCGEEACVTNEIGRTNLSPQVSRYEEGEYYEQEASEIHDSYPISGTVTLVTRTMRKDLSRDHAFVYIRRGENFVSAEPRNATVEEISAMCHRALENWF